MSDTGDASAGETASDDAVFDEVRDAAGAVIASLKQLIEATERVVADPDAFASAVDGGRSIVEAFVGGFAASGESDDGDLDDLDVEPEDAASES